MEFSNSYELLIELRNKDLLKNSPKYWWPNAGTFEVIVGAILTQNTKWENVQKALDNWKIKNREWKLEDISNLDATYLAQFIKSVSFYNQKAKRIVNLSKNILKDFKYFETFKNGVDREWLLNQKGIGFESADAILCYGCFRETMVVDSYTKRLLKKGGYEFDSYDEIKEWCERGILENWDRLSSLYENDLNLCFARFHGKIVEFMKRK